MSSESAGNADGRAGGTAVSDDHEDEPPLRVENLRKEFGGITAVDGASFSVVVSPPSTARRSRSLRSR